MKKGHIFLIVIGVIVAILLSPFTAFMGGVIFEIANGSDAEIEIDSYRLCEGKDGENIIIIKYLFKNEGKVPTSLFYEGDFYAYQNGVGLSEYIDELPKECNYDSEDQYRNVKGGVEYYAEIAYLLEDPDADVEVEIEDYGIFDGKKEKVFSIK